DCRDPLDWRNTSDAHARTLEVDDPTERLGRFRHQRLSKPDLSTTVLEHRKGAARPGGVVGERPVLPVADTSARRDPKTSVASRRETYDPRPWQTRSAFRSPRNESNAVEPEQPGARCDPQVSVRGLCQLGGSALEETVLHPPRGVRVLGDVLARIERARGPGEERQAREAQPHMSQHDGVRGVPDATPSCTAAPPPDRQVSTSL